MTILNYNASCMAMSWLVKRCMYHRKLIYYPQSDWDHTQFGIYLTPVGSQASRPGWLRQVSFNVRVHGHDSPSQSIWASESLLQSSSPLEGSLHCALSSPQCLAYAHEPLHAWVPALL